MLGAGAAEGPRQLVDAPHVAVVPAAVGDRPGCRAPPDERDLRRDGALELPVQSPKARTVLRLRPR